MCLGSAIGPATSSGGAGLRHGSGVAQAKREALAVLLCSSLAEEKSPSPEATGTGQIKLCP